MLARANTPPTNGNVVSALKSAAVGCRLTTSPNAPQIAKNAAPETTATAIAGRL